MSHGTEQVILFIAQALKENSTSVALEGLQPPCLYAYLRREGLEGLAIGKLIALGLGVGEDDGVGSLAVVGDDVLQHARPMPGGNLDGQVLYSRGQLIHLPIDAFVLIFFWGGGKFSAGV